MSSQVFLHSVSHGDHMLTSGGFFSMIWVKTLTDFTIDGRPHSVLSSLLLWRQPCLSTLLSKTSTPITEGFIGFGYFCMAALVTVSQGWLLKVKEKSIKKQKHQHNTQRPPQSVCIARWEVLYFSCLKKKSLVIMRTVMGRLMKHDILQSQQWITYYNRYKYKYCMKKEKGRKSVNYCFHVILLQD